MEGTEGYGALLYDNARYRAGKIRNQFNTGIIKFMIRRYKQPGHSRNRK
ncbi:MAG: hypothetical protein JSV09_03760 [Thermoplasmata archaeon]|nr:MAG: hypothetical protein JSV09_03760 [Thermoplasmata archaeon]